MLAKNVNDNACFLIERGACEFFASKLAPTKSHLGSSRFFAGSLRVLDDISYLNRFNE